MLFVGINPGIRSAAIGHHFAGHSNRFWRLLHESGMVPEPIGCESDRRLPEWGFGMTNLVPRPTAGIHALRPREYRAGRRALERKIRACRPGIVALVGVTIYRALFPGSGPVSRRLSGRPTGAAGGALGPRRETLAGAPVFVLPNPSGRNATLSYPGMLKVFRRLRRTIDRAA